MPDIPTPDQLAQIIDIHRHTFGGFTMMAEPEGGEGEDGEDGDGQKPAAEEPNGEDPQWLAKRLERAREQERSKYADFDDLKAKAARYDELEEQNKTDLQKATERLQSIETERDSARLDGLRFRIAAKHGISDEDADLYLTGRDEDTLTRQAARLSELQPKTSGPQLRIDHSGRTAEPAADKDAAAREFFGI